MVRFMYQLSARFYHYQDNNEEEKEHGYFIEKTIVHMAVGVLIRIDKGDITTALDMIYQ